MNLKNYKDFAYFDYAPYLFAPHNKEQILPDVCNRPFDLGDVVFHKYTHTVGVVIGCVDYDGEELRTDADGMVSFCEIELFSDRHLNESPVMGEKLSQILKNTNPQNKIPNQITPSDGV